MCWTCPDENSHLSRPLAARHADKLFVADVHLGPLVIEIFSDMVFVFFREDSFHVVFGELVPARRRALEQTVRAVLATRASHVAGFAEIVASSFALVATCSLVVRITLRTGKFEALTVECAGPKKRLAELTAVFLGEHLFNALLSFVSHESSENVARIITALVHLVASIAYCRRFATLVAD